MTQAQLEPDVLHAEGVRNLLTPSGYPAYLGENEIPDEPPFPYYVAWAIPGEPLAADERLRGYAGSITTRHQITVAALTPLDVIGACARARNLLHRQRPTISGRRCGDIDMEPGLPVPVADPAVTGPQGQRIYIAYLTFSLTSTLAPNQS